MENKQTAVDFLWEEMQEFIAYCGTHALANELNAKYLKAKEMAKEQIMDAFHDGCQLGYNQVPYNCEEYYKENYGKENDRN